MHVAISLLCNSYPARLSAKAQPAFMYTGTGTSAGMLCHVQVQKLRQEKDVLESKLKEFERSLQKLKDCTYQEATQKREYERRVQAVQADLRGAHLREQARCLFCHLSCPDLLVFPCCVCVWLQRGASFLCIACAT